MRDHYRSNLSDDLKFFLFISSSKLLPDFSVTDYCSLKVRFTPFALICLVKIVFIKLNDIGDVDPRESATGSIRPMARRLVI